MESGKLVLGTVQFGCNYGINSAGRPDSASVTGILTEAARHGITKLDTSSAYGNSEEVLGCCIPQSGATFDIISKYPKGSGPLDKVAGESLKRLGCNSLYGYLLHHFEVWKDNPAIWDGFKRLKDAGVCGKTGFSLYSPDELELLLEKDVDFDLIQVPHNIFDRRFDGYFPELKRKGVEIHVRSTFLQGLFFKDRNSLPEKLSPLRKYLQELDESAKENSMSVTEMALNYNIHNPYIDGVLIGVDNVSQLMDNINAVRGRYAAPDIRVSEQELLNPTNWN